MCPGTVFCHLHAQIKALQNPAPWVVWLQQWFSPVGEFNLTVFLPTSAGQILYGRVLWNPEQNLNAAYKLQLEKVYLCTGKDGYVPFFDPTGTVYNEGPQYGCIQPNKHLKHRFLLLVSFLRCAKPRCGISCVIASGEAWSQPLADLTDLGSKRPPCLWGEALPTLIFSCC